MTPRGPQLDAELRALDEPSISVEERLSAAGECILSLAAAVLDLERRLAKLEKRDEYR